MTTHRTAWHWAAAFFALGAFLVLIAAATDEPGDGEPAGEAATVTLDEFEGSAAEPTVTVEPATDLVDHQVVTVHGEGFDPAGSATLWQCFDEGGGCGSDFTEIDDDGTFTRTVGVSAAGTSFDCREPGSDCTLTVQAYEEESGESRTVGTVPLEFDPDAPLTPAASVAATPLSGLVDGDAITITGENFRPGDGLTAIVCGTPEYLSEDCVPTTGVGGGIVDDDGRFEHPYRATARASDLDTDLDCRRDDCFLHVEDPDGAATTFPLEFEPDSPLAPPPEAFALVVEGQDLRVQGEGFLPGEEVYTGVCIRRDGERQCHAPTPHHTTADGDGAIDSTFTPEPFDGFAGVEDCRQHRCWVFVEGTSLPARDDDIRAPFALDP